MANISESIYSIRLLDELAEKKTVIHQIHPFIKVLTTGVYLIVAVSFGKYELSGLVPLLFYPVVVMSLAEIPPVPILKRVLLALPLIIGIGLFNPLIDRTPMVVLPWVEISGGWISFFSILFKGLLAILAALILMATTGMTKIAAALRTIRIPKIFVMQFLLTYRYILVLIEEVWRVLRAYGLRSPATKGIQFKTWGSLTGQLLLRSLDRAQRIYAAMCCRGFTGEYNVAVEKSITIRDVVYFVSWSLFFILVRYFNIAELAGSLIL